MKPGIEVLLVLVTSLVTWIWTTARWHARVASRQANWRHIEAALHDEITALHEEVMRARSRASELARESAAFAAGYEHGRTEMIAAVAALHGDAGNRHRTAGDAAMGQ